MLTKLISAVAVAVSLQSAVTFASENTQAFEVPYDTAELESDALIYSVRLRLRNGSSVWTDDLRVPTSANPIKIRVVLEPSCRAPRVALYLRSVSDGIWYQTIPSGDSDYHNLAAFNGIRMEIQQPYILDQVCEFRISGAMPDAPAPNPGPTYPSWGPGVLSGGVEFNGGFASNLEVNISTAQRIKGFRFAVPDFCGPVEVHEAGIITEGVFEPATLIDAAARLYKVHGDSVRASRIVFSLNGPYDSRCFVPLYVYAEG